MSVKLSISLIICIILVIFFVLCKGASINDANPVVLIPQLGILRGSITKTAWSENRIYQFLGIPFAIPPSGNLRFKPPKPFPPWDGVKNAIEYGRRCPEITMIRQLTSVQLEENLEDCLNLNIFTKNLDGKLPVMVYIHGGGFYNGSASDHPPNYLLEKDIVLVVLQYRIGALGFLSTRSEEIPGNMAMLDVILALQWIKNNIQHFGGDSESVTIFGQSAGAAISSLLIISPLTPQGLFHRAIIQSGSILASWAYNENPIEKTKIICQMAGCLDCSNQRSIHECLISVPVVELLEISSKIPFTLSTKDFYGVMPTNPSGLLSNYSKQYAVMGGVTKHDGSFALQLIYDGLKEKIGNFSQISPYQFIKRMIFGFEEKDKSGVIGNLVTKMLFKTEELEKRDYKALIPGFIDLAGIITMKSPVLSFVKANALYNHHSNYLYTFDYKGEHTRFGYEKGTEQYPFNGGIHHSDDNLYIFPTHKLNKNDSEIAKTMIDLWTSFAIHGAPKAANGPLVTPVSYDFAPYMHIDREISIGHDFLDEFSVSVNDPHKDELIRHNKIF